MASQLLVAQKEQLVEHKADFEEDGRKMLFKDQLAYCQENSEQSVHEQQCDQQNLGKQRVVVKPLERRQPGKETIEAPCLRGRQQPPSAR